VGIDNTVSMPQKHVESKGDDSSPTKQHGKCKSGRFIFFSDRALIKSKPNSVATAIMIAAVLPDFRKRKKTIASKYYNSERVICVCVVFALCFIHFMARKTHCHHLMPYTTLTVFVLIHRH
jgi:hypothetical protein